MPALRLLVIAASLAALLPATGAAYEESLYIDSGRPVTATPEVRLTLAGPEDAEFALVAGDPQLRGAIRLPARGEADWRLDAGRADGTQRLFARYFTAVGQPLPEFDTSDGLSLIHI